MPGARTERVWCCVRALLSQQNGLGWLCLTEAGRQESGSGISRFSAEKMLQEDSVAGGGDGECPSVIL